MDQIAAKGLSDKEKKVLLGSIKKKLKKDYRNGSLTL